jgi:hypothetical protein
MGIKLCPYLAHAGTVPIPVGKFAILTQEYGSSGLYMDIEGETIVLSNKLRKPRLELEISSLRPCWEMRKIIFSC